VPADAPPPDLTDPAAFGHWVTDTVRFSDQDAVGHVNNVAVAAYVESGRLAFGRHVAGEEVAASGFVLARLVVDYRRQFHWPGEVRIGSRVLRVGTSSYGVGHGIFKDGACVATGEGVLVRVGDDGRPTPIEPELRARLVALAGAPGGTGAAGGTG
jgi:acyl-CoA thioester hydrolase